MKRINQKYSIRDLAGEPTTVKYEIASQARLAARVAEIVLTIIVLAVLSNLKQENLPEAIRSDRVHSLAMGASITALLFAFAGMIVHIFPAIFKWKIRSVLISEFILDIICTSVWIASIASMIQQGTCAPGVQSCDQYNVAIAFSFFSAVAWLVSFIFDMQGLVKYCKSQ